MAAAISPRTIGWERGSSATPALSEAVFKLMQSSPNSDSLFQKNVRRCFALLFPDHRRAPPEGAEGNGFIDVFCGAGGLSLGLEAGGFHPVIAVDQDKSACATYLFNRPHMSDDAVMNAPISELIGGRLIPAAPIVIGGPPCQGFSMANRQRLSVDPRNALYREFITVVRLANCRIAIMENVPAMADAIPMMVDDFNEIGFSIRSFRINSLDFGFPQNRDRIFVLAIKSTNRDVTDTLFNTFDSVINAAKILHRYIYVLDDAIFGLPPLQAKTVRNNTAFENDSFGYTVSENADTHQNNYLHFINRGINSRFLFNHRTKYNNKRDIEIFSRLCPGEKSDAASIQDIMPYKSRSHIFTDKFYRLRADSPCKTITAHMYYDCHMYIHPTQHRGLTPREAARVQGFPDDYFFFGLPNEWYRQIGNAVSPLVARIVGSALRSVVNEWSSLRK